jgi:outer membrane protein assembly factor BamB
MTGIQWNVTFTVEGNPSISRLAGDKFIWRTTTNTDGTVVASDSAFDLREGNEGELLWGPKERTAQPSIVTGPYGEGVYVSYVKETMVWYGYDASTGAQIWGPTEPYSDPFGMYGSTAEIAYGRIYTMSYGGTVYCWNVTTGEPLWEYYTGSAGLESPYGHYPQWEGMTVADGKVFVTSYEHSPDSPLWRGARMHAIDVETGDLVWNILGWYQGSGAAIADGIMVQHNYGDNRVYAFGKGPSATTVTASPKVSVNGDSVLIEGTVIDTAAGTDQDEQAARFPNGVPAIADDNMTAWMEYVYMQKPMPTDATGVEVVLETLDPNGNFYEIGRTTSDASGTYSYMFTPEVPGKYAIIATFEGSESYWGSHAETAIGVEDAPQPTPTPTPTPAPMTDTYVIGFGSAMIVLIAVIGALLLLRKR